MAPITYVGPNTTLNQVLFQSVILQNMLTILQNASYMTSCDEQRYVVRQNGDHIPNLAFEHTISGPNVMAQMMLFMVLVTLTLTFDLYSWQFRYYIRLSPLSAHIERSYGVI